MNQKPSHFMLEYRTTIALILWSALAASACARSAPLPGDSVSLDGAVAVAPPHARPQEGAVAPPLGAVESRLFPPELLMERQAALGIDERQRAAITGEVERAQAEMGRLRWDLEKEREVLVKLLDAEPVDENAVAASGKRMTDAESRIKAIHLTMLVRVKNTLTPAQKAKLRSVRTP